MGNPWVELYTEATIDDGEALFCNNYLQQERGSGVVELLGASHENEFEGMTQKKAVTVNMVRLFPCSGAYLVVTTINGVTHPCPAPKPLFKKQEAKKTKTKTTKQRLCKRNVRRKAI